METITKWKTMLFLDPCPTQHSQPYPWHNPHPPHCLRSPFFSQFRRPDCPSWTVKLSNQSILASAGHFKGAVAARFKFSKKKWWRRSMLHTLPLSTQSALKWWCPDVAVRACMMIIIAALPHLSFPPHHQMDCGGKSPVHTFLDYNLSLGPTLDSLTMEHPTLFLNVFRSPLHIFTIAATCGDRMGGSQLWIKNIILAKFQGSRDIIL